MDQQAQAQGQQAQQAQQAQVQQASDFTFACPDDPQLAAKIRPEALAAFESAHTLYQLCHREVHSVYGILMSSTDRIKEAYQARIARLQEEMQAEIAKIERGKMEEIEVIKARRTLADAAVRERFKEVTAGLNPREETFFAMTNDPVGYRSFKGITRHRSFPVLTGNLEIGIRDYYGSRDESTKERALIKWCETFREMLTIDPNKTYDLETQLVTRLKK